MQFVLLVDDDGKCSYLVGNDADEWVEGIASNEMISQIHGGSTPNYQWRETTVDELVELIKTRKIPFKRKLTVKDRVKSGIVYSAVALMISIFIGVIIFPWLSFTQYEPTTNILLLYMLVSILAGYMIGLFKPMKFEE